MLSLFCISLKREVKKSRQANTGTIQNFYFSFLCVSINNKNIISIILISDIIQDLPLYFVWWVENDIRDTDGKMTDDELNQILTMTFEENK